MDELELWTNKKGIKNMDEETNFAITFNSGLVIFTILLYVWAFSKGIIP